MTDERVIDSSPTPAGPNHPVSRIQTDLFCRACGANLYNRPVWRSEGAGLLVTACESCGALAAADDALPYRRLWRQRLGVTLMIGWMMMIGGIIAGVIGVEFAFQVQTPAIGRVTYAGPRWTPSTSPKLKARAELDRNRTRDRLVVSIPASLLTAFVGGCLLACVTYHWRMGWHLLASVAGPIVALACAGIERNGPYVDGWLKAALPVVLTLAVVQIVGGIIGVLLGRPVGRTALRIALPNRSRKYFAFLWRRDGKETPAGPF